MAHKSATLVFYESPVKSYLKLVNKAQSHWLKFNASTIVPTYPRGIRSAVTSEFHLSTIVPTYGAGRAGGAGGVKNYEISRVDRFRYRTGYLTDSGIIGTKEFVSENYQRFKGVFLSIRDKIPRPVAGLDGIYSLKRLVER